MSRTTTAALLFGALALAASACGGDDDGAPATTGGATPETSVDTTIVDAYPITVDAANGPVTLDAAPQRIVSLSPTATEMLFAIGAGDQVVAVDDQSNYPDEALAKSTDLSGYTPSAEAVSGYQPDLVVMADVTDGFDTQLAALDIPLWSGPFALDFGDVYTQIEQLGALTGHVGEAAALVGQMQAAIEDATGGVVEREVPLTYYHELDDTFFTVTSETLIGRVYGLFDLHNIADAVEGDTNTPQLSSEFIVSQNPDLIFLADADYGASPETVAARPGWADLDAVTTGSVVPISADIASRWGPRVVDFVEAVAAAIQAHDAKVPAG